MCNFFIVRIKLPDPRHSKPGRAFLPDISQASGDATMLFLGVGLVVVAIIIDALIYRRVQGDGNQGIGKGLIMSIIAGIAMGFFYRFVAQAMSFDFANPDAGLMTPYSAAVVFGIGLLLSNVIFLIPLMYKPIIGEPAKLGEYFSLGSPKLHLVGILGGAIWATGFCFNIIAAGKAGYAVSYGLGQGATMVAAFWGVFIWKEFKDTPPGTGHRDAYRRDVCLLLPWPGHDHLLKSVGIDYEQTRRNRLVQYGHDNSGTAAAGTG